MDDVAATGTLWIVIPAVCLASTRQKRIGQPGIALQGTVGLAFLWDKKRAIVVLLLA
jgi:hypothetical protein